MTNHDLLNKTIEYIQEHPESLVSDSFFSGKSACVIGRAWCIHHDKTPRQGSKEYSEKSILEFIGTTLGLDKDQAFTVQHQWGTHVGAVAAVQYVLEMLEVQELA